MMLREWFTFPLISLLFLLPIMLRAGMIYLITV